MTNNPSASEIEGVDASTDVPAGAHLEDTDPSSLQELNFDDGKLLLFVRSPRWTDNAFRGPNQSAPARSI